MAILAGFLCTFIVGGLKALDGTLNVGAYGVLVFLTQRLLWPLTDLAKTVDLYERAMASTRRILGLIEAPIKIRNSGTRTFNRPCRGEVSFNNLNFYYPNSRSGLHKINLDLPAGTTTALVGATGSGKSTLVKLLLRFYEPDCGTITLDGIPIDELSLTTLREQLGLVSQDIFLFDGTIRDNIAYGNPLAEDAEIVEAAKAAEAWELSLIHISEPTRPY